MSKYLKIAAGVLAGAALLTLVGPVVGETIATLPPAFAPDDRDSLAPLGLPYENVSFPSTDGLELRGWFVPTKEPDAPAIIYAPATAHDQRSGMSLVPAFHRAGYQVLLFSYRGHALSDGRKGRFSYGDAESRDVDAAVRFLRVDKGVQRIALVGHSVGAVSAILSAARNTAVGAVVAVAPFRCVTEVWQTSRPALVPPFVLNWALWIAEKRAGFDRDDVCPADVIEHIAPRPLLIIHGTADQRITEVQARRLFAAAGEPKALWLAEGVSHEQIRTPALDALLPDVIAFLDKALATERTKAAWPRLSPTGQSVLQ